jgi:3-isopropylmalate/(R)-2-methylmalate dehydratase small subunit
MSTATREPITTITSRYVAIDACNIDTDQIIPARFLKTTSRAGLGPHAFHDWRYYADGSPNPEFALNAPAAREAHILVAGHNFGCGSSREHAVWALMGAGIRAVISSGFADIFRGNALGNGLVPVQVNDETVRALTERRWAGDATLAIDLESQTLTLPDRRVVSFPIPAFARHCLIRGLDELEFLLDAIPEIERYEGARAPVSIAE